MSKTPKREPFGLGVTFLVGGGLILLLAIKLHQTTPQGEDVFNPFWALSLFLAIIGTVIIQPYVTDEIRASKAKKESLQNNLKAKKFYEKQSISQQPKANQPAINNKKEPSKMTIKQKYQCFVASSIVFSVFSFGAIFPLLMLFFSQSDVDSEIFFVSFFVALFLSIDIYSIIMASKCRKMIKGKKGRIQYSESALDFMQTELLSVIADFQKKRNEEISEIIQNLQDKNDLLLKQNAENVVGSEALIGSIQLELSKSRDDYRSQETAYNLMIKELRDKNAVLEEDLKNAKAEQWKYRSLYEYNRDGRKTDILAMRDLVNLSSRETVKKIYETMPLRFASPDKWREDYLRLFLTYGVDLMEDKETIRKQIAEIEHFAFEDFVRDLFRALTYEAETTQRSGDFGADVIAKRDDVVIVIQCKHTSVLKGTLPFNAVQEIFMAKANYNADKAMIVTNSRATKQASSSAQNLHVSIWDFDILYEKLISIVNL